MGEGSEPVAVADAGPLIHLYEVGGLVLLGVFPEVHVPQAVWDEAVRSGRVPEDELGASFRLARHRVSAEDVDRYVDPAARAALQPGECECLVLCRRLGIPLLLTDDLAAREAAKAVGVRPVGSLGVVVRAFHRRHVARAEAESMLERLHSVSSLFVTRAIVDLAIEQLRHSP